MLVQNFLSKGYCDEYSFRNVFDLIVSFGYFEAGFLLTGLVLALALGLAAASLDLAKSFRVNSGRAKSCRV